MSNPDLQTLAKAVGDDWVAGKYYGDAERHMDVQWERVIWPMIKCSDFTVTLDLAAGHGRNTAKLLDHAERMIAVDINESNIETLTNRFRDQGNISLVQNNGSDLRDVAGASVTFLYSFDAMVHFDSDVVRAYVAEFRRVMKPGARGFCHYSNNASNPTGTYRDHPGWRNFMSRSLFEHWLSKQGFRVIESRYLKGVLTTIDHDDGDCDAITLFELPHSAEPLGEFLDFGRSESVANAGSNAAAQGWRAEFDRLTGEIQGQRAEIDKLKDSSAGFQRHAAGLEEINRQLREESGRLGGHRDSLLAKIDVLEKHANVLQAMLNEAVRENATWSERMRWMEQEQQRLAREMEALRHDLAEAGDARRALLASTSWRVTMPLRLLRGRFGRRS